MIMTFDLYSSKYRICRSRVLHRKVIITKVFQVKYKQLCPFTAFPSANNFRLLFTFWIMGSQSSFAAFLLFWLDQQYNIFDVIRTPLGYITLWGTNMACVLKIYLIVMLSPYFICRLCISVIQEILHCRVAVTSKPLRFWGENNCTLSCFFPIEKQLNVL